MTHSALISHPDVEEVRLRVAEKIGWRELRYTQAGFLIGHPPGLKSIRPVPSYAVDIKAAWDIVTFLAIKQIRVSVANDVVCGRIRNYFVEIGSKDRPLAKACDRTSSLSICLAFLQVPESEIDEPCPAARNP